MSTANFHVDTQPALWAEYLRVAMLGVAIWDYIQTLPTEWRIYRAQKGRRRISVLCALFVLIRYLSVSVIVFSSVGYFYKGFTAQACSHYFFLAPVFKVGQIMASQAIMGYRTFMISRSDPRMAKFIIGFYVLACSMQWFTTLYKREYVQTQGNCHAFNSNTFLTAWAYYLIAIIFDLVTVGVSVVYLLKYIPEYNGVPHFLTVMLYDGLGYFVVITFANVCNLVLYHTSGNNAEIQTAGVSAGYTVTWIMSQNILIHLYEAATTRELREFANVGSVVMTHSLDPQSLSHILHSQQMDAPFRKPVFSLSGSETGPGNKKVTRNSGGKFHAPSLYVSASASGAGHTPLSPLTPTALLSPRSRDRAVAQEMIGQLDREDDMDVENGLTPEPLQVRVERSVRMERSAAARNSRAQRDAASQQRVMWPSGVPKSMD